MVILSIYPYTPDLSSERGSTVTSFQVEGVHYINGSYIDLTCYNKDYTSIYTIHDNYALLGTFDLTYEGVLIESFVGYPDLKAVTIDCVAKHNPVSFYRSEYPEYLFFTSGNRKQRVLHRYNLVTGDDLVVPAKGKPHYMSERVFVSGLTGYDSSGNEIWRFEWECPHRIAHYRSKVSAVNGLLVFPQGGLEGEPDTVIALEAETGSKVWEYPLPFEARRVSVEHGKVCLATGNQMLALDPHSGELQAQFEADIEDSIKTMLWYDGAYYYVIDNQGNRLQAYDPNTLDKVMEWCFPDEFRPQINYPPDKIDDKNGMQLLNASLVDAGVYGGLLTWTPDDVEAGNTIEFDQPYPDVEVKIIKERKKEAYQVKLHTQDLHNLLRYGEIEIKRIAANYGKHMWSQDTVNKQFNGHIELLVDPAIGEENAQYLDALMRRCEYFAQLGNVTSGGGRQPIKPTWRFNH